MTLDSLSYRSIPVHHFSDRTAGLEFLLSYAVSHQHSRLWIGPLTRLLTQNGVHHA
jgi:hypothetical protein